MLKVSKKKNSKNEMMFKVEKNERKAERKQT